MLLGSETPVTFDIDAYSSPPATYPADGHERPGVKSLYFENEPYHGKETRVFAWLGMPYLQKGQTCPAMVLVHGGGGTAFDEWVRLWNGRGYAAIVIDQCGCKPETPIPQLRGVRERHDSPGPTGWDASWHQMDEEVESHWQYHAITALLRAHTLISNTEGVDPDRVGITGISWGGYITSLMMGIDSRYAAAIPVYGCGFVTENSAWSISGYDNARPADVKKWAKYWAPEHYIPSARMPTLWVTGTNDGAYHMDSFKKSYSLAPDPTVSIGVEMGHSHSHGWAPKEIHHFTDSIFRGGAPLPEHTETRIENSHIVSTFKSSRPLMRAEICYTRALGMWPDRKWNTISVPPEETGTSYRVTTELPVGTTVAFVNVWDDRDVFASSPHIESVNS